MVVESGEIKDLKYEEIKDLKWQVQLAKFVIWCLLAFCFSLFMGMVAETTHTEDEWQDIVSNAAADKISPVIEDAGGTGRCYPYNISWQEDKYKGSVICYGVHEEQNMMVKVVVNFDSPTVKTFLPGTRIPIEINVRGPFKMSGYKYVGSK